MAGGTGAVRLAAHSPSAVGVVVADRAGRIHSVDAHAATVLGFGVAELVGRPLTDLIPERFHADHTRAFERWASTGTLGRVGDLLSLPFLHADGSEIEMAVTIEALSGERDRVAATIRPLALAAPPTPVSDITRELLGRVADASDTQELIQQCLELLGRRLSWDVALAWLPDPVIGALRVGGSWTVDTEAAESYRGASVSVSLRRDQGHPGRVWHSQEEAWVPDPGDDPVFRRREAARLSGITGVFLFPLLDGRDVVGVVELASTTRKGLDIASHEAFRALQRPLGRLVRKSFLREQLAVESQRLQLALHAGGMGVWTLDFGSSTVVLSPEIERIFGVEPGDFEVTTDRLLTAIHPDDREAVVSEFARVSQQPGSFRCRHRVVHQGGEERWVESAGHTLLSAEGDVRGVTGVSSDVTDQVRANAELQERARHAQLSAEIGLAFTSRGDLHTKLQRCAQAIVANLDAAFARIWLMDDTQSVLDLRASAGMYTHLDGPHSRVAVGQLTIGAIAQSGSPHRSNDVVNDPRVSDREWASREGLKAFAGYPLMLDDECIGVVAMFARDVLSETTLAAFSSASDGITVGIEQVRARETALALLQQTRRESEARRVALEERARVAAVLQQSLLPPTLPLIPGVELAARYVASSEEIGGDTYDAFRMRRGAWGLLIADVCGKGPDAAALTALARHTVRTGAMVQRRPSQVIRTLNEAVLASGDEGRFCTALFATLRVTGDAASLHLANAGHPPMLVVRAATGAIEEHHPRGVVAGVFAGAAYEDAFVQLEPGDLVALYTDGITEARRSGDLFGSDRLAQLILQRSSDSVEAIADAIVDAARDFDESAGDDMAVLLMRISPRA